MTRFFNRGLRPSLSDDRGGLSVFVLLTGVAVILAAGLALDGGQRLRAFSEASSVAQEAARAGAGQIDTDRLMTEGGDWTIGADNAIATANAYLRDNGYEGNATISADGMSVQVTVTITRDTLILQMIGIDQIKVTRTAEADLVQGINGEGV